MCNRFRKYRFAVRPLILLAFSLISINSFAQLRAIGDTVIVIPSGSFIQIKDSISYFSNDTILWVPSGIDPYVIYERERNKEFYDSLRTRASRKPFAKKIYDLVVVAPEQSNHKEITKESDRNYIDYEGKKIRKIEIRRLNVFGTSINNPADQPPEKYENILNKTHINTLEGIIRKNLLFKTGESISPLVLSDNERLLRRLSFIDDARIIVVPVSEEEADIIVITKDVYSLGASYDYRGFKRGNFSLFEKNIFGLGHELGFDFPFDTEKYKYPGFGINYKIDNISKTFINFKAFFMDGLGQTGYGFSLNRPLVSSATKYAGGISVTQMYTSEDFDTMTVAEPLSYNLQDYWLSRSFLFNTSEVKRLIIGARYYNNNVFEHPEIFQDSYYKYQQYKIFLGSVAFSHQKYYKTNLIYSYGRTEDVPYGAMFRFTGGREFNEFKTRTYLGADISVGKSFRKVGYFYSSFALGGYLIENKKEQGVFAVRMNYFSNLLSSGRNKIRNFVTVDYSRGVGRYTDEYLRFQRENGFTGFRNDSIKGTQRLTLSLESVLFSPSNLFGFRFAYYGFADIGYLSDSNETISNGFILTSIGLGIRIRNNNLLFNTLQIRIAFFPVKPEFSRINNVVISGEQLLKPYNFDPGPPSVIIYH